MAHSAMLAPPASEASSGSRRSILRAQRLAAGQKACLRTDTDANLELGKGALVLVAVIIGAVVVIQIVAALFPTFFNSVAAINENLTTTSTGDDTADSLLPIFRILVGLGALFGIIGIVLAAIAIKNRSS